MFKLKIFVEFFLLRILKAVIFRKNLRTWSWRRYLNNTRITSIESVSWDAQRAEFNWGQHKVKEANVTIDICARVNNNLNRLCGNLSGAVESLYISQIWVNRDWLDNLVHIRIDLKFISWLVNYRDERRDWLCVRSAWPGVSQRDQRVAGARSLQKLISLQRFPLKSKFIRCLSNYEGWTHLFRRIGIWVERKSGSV